MCGWRRSRRGEGCAAANDHHHPLHARCVSAHQAPPPSLSTPLFYFFALKLGMESEKPWPQAGQARSFCAHPMQRLAWLQGCSETKLPGPPHLQKRKLTGGLPAGTSFAAAEVLKTGTLFRGCAATPENDAALSPPRREVEALVRLWPSKGSGVDKQPPIGFVFTFRCFKFAIHLLELELLA